MTNHLDDQHFAALRAIRRDLHTMPELSGHEQRTAARISALLADFGPDEIVEGLGGTGVAALYQGRKPGVTVMIRCELDGLPIAETGERSYRSMRPGHGHQCGHDGHMSILLGVASTLGRQRPLRGRVILLFQPAEEIGSGARAVIADPRFDQLKPDCVLALHNLPGHALHQVIVKSGHIHCASRGMRVRFTGKTAHASMPETGISPAHALASVIGRLEQLSSATAMDEKFALVTVVHAHLGEKAFGVAPGDAEIWATLRTVADRQMDGLVESAAAIAQQAADEHRLTCTIDYHDIFHACTNDTGLVDQVRRSAAELGLAVTELEEPMRFSEDFGEYGSAARAAMFFLGAGTGHPALHNPDYDFPDDLIRSGTSMFLSTLNRILESENPA